MKTVYFVLMDAVKGDPTWDTFCGIFNTYDEAFAAAESQWTHLSDREQRRCIVSVNHADVEDDVALEDAYDVICERGDGWYEDDVFVFSDLWYAVMMDREDNDWGYGSHALAEAKKMARRYREHSHEAYIAVIDESGPTAFCIEEIHDLDA